MPDNPKQPPAPDYDAEYAKTQRPAPAVPLHVHADKGWIPGVAMRGTGPGGDFTAEETHARLTHGQYEAGLKAGILSRVAEAKPDKADKPAPKAAPAPAPAQKEGEA